MRTTRRDFLGLAACSLTACNTEKFIITEYKIEYHNLKHLSLIFLSDIHFSSFNDSLFIERLKKILLEPLKKTDFVLLGGDYHYIKDSHKTNQTSISKLKSCLIDFLTFLKESNRPVLAILGNHDRKYQYLDYIRAFSYFKIPLLINRAFEMNNVSFWGADDFLTGFPTMPEKKVDIVLTHSPDYYHYYLKKRRQYFKLCLAGHTHGGQIRLPFIKPFLLNIGFTKYLEGHFWEEDNHLIVSRGIGCVGIPLRLNCPPEISFVRFT